MRVSAESEPGRWRLKPDSRIGVAVGPTWEVRVSPRLSVPRLFFLLSYASDPRGWKDEQARFAAEPRLLDAIAAGFSWHALRALGLGVLRGYAHVEERLATVRGRIRFGDQIARSASLPVPVEVAYEEYTADIAENRILKSAAVALLRLPRISALTRRRLLRLRAILDDVTLLTRPREVKLPLQTRINERYAPALRLGEMILRASSLDFARGQVSSVAFVFDMNRVFEEFVSTALREAMRPHGGELRLQVRTTLDVGGRVPVVPDIAWYASGRPLAVLDAKHKALKIGGMPNADAYQMLAYCAALDLPRGYLVYAKDGGGRTEDLKIRNSARCICVRALDIEAEPEDLLGQVGDLAVEVAASRQFDATLVALS